MPFPNFRLTHRRSCGSRADGNGRRSAFYEAGCALYATVCIVASAPVCCRSRDFRRIRPRAAAPIAAGCFVGAAIKIAPRSVDDAEGGEKQLAEASMRGPLSLRNPTGWLTALAVLAVASLGVTLVYVQHASDGANASNALPVASEGVPAEGLSCEAASPNATVDVNVAIELARQRAAATPHRDGAIVVLNSRGYNYGVAPTPDPRIAVIDATLGR